MSAAGGSSRLSRFCWRCVDVIGLYVLYVPLQSLFRLLQMPVQKYVDSYYVLSEQERIARQGILNSRPVWFRRMWGWFVVFFWGLCFALILYTVLVTFNNPVLGALIYILGVVYFLNIWAFWRDFERFFCGQRFFDDRRYLSPFLMHSDDMTLHFFSTADLIAAGGLHIAPEQLRKIVLRGVNHAFIEIRRRVQSGELDKVAEMRFHQYVLHPGRNKRWGLVIYRPSWQARICARSAHLLLWPRVAYASSFVRPRPLRLSHTLRITFSRGTARDIRGEGSGAQGAQQTTGMGKD